MRFAKFRVFGVFEIRGFSGFVGVYVSGFFGVFRGLCFGVVRVFSGFMFRVFSGLFGVSVRKENRTILNLYRLYHWEFDRGSDSHLQNNENHQA